MTREEAVKTLDEMFDFYDELHENTDGECGYEEMQAITVAISALQAEPYTDIVPITDKPIGEFDASTGIVTYYGKTRPSDLISRADAIEAVCKWCEHPYCESKEKCGQWIAMTILPSADRPTPNYITESANDLDEKNDEVIERPIIEHDREWIIGCIKHDGFIKTDRFDKANQIILDALADRPSGEWIFDTEIPIGKGRTSAGYRCSVCGADFFQISERANYCMVCGARMKGGGDD